MQNPILSRRSLFLLFSFSLFFCSSFIFALDVPLVKAMFTDETMTVSSRFEEEMEQILRYHESQTSNEVAVLMIPTLAGESIEAYSIEVAQTWKLGKKQKDNGVLLLIAKEDRKLRIEVGYGLEGVLTDVLCSRIIEGEIKPYFKKGDYETGIRKGVDSILGIINGTYAPAPPKDYSYWGPLSFFGDFDGGGENIPWPIRLFASLFVLFVLGIFTYQAATLPIIGWFLYFFLFPFWSLFPIALHGVDIGVSVFLIYAVGIGLWKLYHLLTPHGRKRMEEYSFSSGGSSGSYGGGGSGYSSGSSWSSSSSSGGFSGGGGSFGGGGSSSSW
ncbi:TPM domain-containing protein [Leptospira idonii]|uniref:YgcG family protein n=1 Tax=Leptospira idonii TaxID=1193500 RepID=A0A4R9LU58_9LEPT|nr:TPM domain-containing protein [Leptospira idonii]TGN17306.1 YgcG family protein [Leptospira idonii]